MCEYQKYQYYALNFGKVVYTLLWSFHRFSPPSFLLFAAKSKAKAKSRSTRAGLQFPVGRVHRLLKKGNYAERVGAGAPVYLCAVMEYLAAEILELAGKELRVFEVLNGISCIDFNCCRLSLVQTKARFSEIILLIRGFILIITKNSKIIL